MPIDLFAAPDPIEVDVDYQHTTGQHATGRKDRHVMISSRFSAAEAAQLRAAAAASGVSVSMFIRERVLATVDAPVVDTPVVDVESLRRKVAELMRELDRYSPR